MHNTKTYTITGGEEITMRRIWIHSEYLNKQIELIAEAISKNSKSIEMYANRLIPPPPIISIDDSSGKYKHISKLGMVIRSALIQLEKSMHDISLREWQQCLSIYLETNFDDEMALAQIQVDDEIWDIIQSIGVHIDALNLNIRNFTAGRSSGEYSGRIIANLAIIWLARYLADKASKMNEISDET